MWLGFGFGLAFRFGLGFGFGLGLEGHLLPAAGDDGLDEAELDPIPRDRVPEADDLHDDKHEHEELDEGPPGLRPAAGRLVPAEDVHLVRVRVRVRPDRKPNTRTLPQTLTLTS